MKAQTERLIKAQGSKPTDEFIRTRGILPNRLPQRQDCPIQGDHSVPVSIQHSLLTND